MRMNMMTKKNIDWDDPDWKDVCSQFYHACGGMNGCGDLDWIDSLIKEYQSYFEEKKDEV